MTKEEALEWIKCAESKEYFIDTYCLIKGMDEETKLPQIMPFKLHGYQREVLQHWTLHRKSIILKSRQVGLSWLTCADNLHDALFHSAWMTLIISKRESDAYDLMERIQFMYDNLPSFLQLRVTERNKGTLAFTNSSKIESQPTTKDAGRSRSPSKLVVDEYAFCRYAADLMNSAETALSHGGKCVLLSTANGYGNEFARTWFGAKRDENDYFPIFLPWWVYPGRTQEWLDQEMKGKPAWMVSQEYPGTWEEAFKQTGRPVFDWDCLQRTASVTEPIVFDDAEDLKIKLRIDQIRKAPMVRVSEDDENPPTEHEGEHQIVRYMSNLFIYQLPAKDACYLIGADVAEGLEHGDNNSITIIDRETGEEVACWYGKIKPHVFAALLHEMTQLYPGLLLPERNNHGQTVCNLLEMWRTPHLHWSKPLWDSNGKKVKERKSGWETTSGNKTTMIDELGMALKLGWYKPASAIFIREAEKYETQADGKYSAPSGFTDDSVMSAAIAWGGRKFLVLFEGLSSGKKRESMGEETY